MDHDETWHAGLRSGHTVLDGDPAPPRKKGTAPTQFLADVYCGHTAIWMNTPLGMEVDLSLSHIVLDGDPAPLPLRKRAQHPPFGPCLLCPWSPISATAELLFTDVAKGRKHYVVCRISFIL